jgi:hypothetical protein
LGQPKVTVTQDGNSLTIKYNGDEVTCSPEDPNCLNTGNDNEEEWDLDWDSIFGEGGLFDGLIDGDANGVIIGPGANSGSVVSGEQPNPPPKNSTVEETENNNNDETNVPHSEDENNDDP